MWVCLFLGTRPKICGGPLSFPLKPRGKGTRKKRKTHIRTELALRKVDENLLQHTAPEILSQPMYMLVSFRMICSNVS